jgi:hypothetical protein
METRADLEAATDSPKGARIVAKWILSTHRLAIYDLAEKIGGTRERLRRPDRAPDRATLRKADKAKLTSLLEALGTVAESAEDRCKAASGHFGVGVGFAPVSRP